MNWALFALSIAVVMTAIWIVVLAKSRRSLTSIYVVRGYVDPNYAGYGFGLLRADKGLLVTFMAGSVFLVSAVCAFLAARNRTGQAMWIVAVACSAFAVIKGWPWLEGVLHDPTGNAIQWKVCSTTPPGTRSSSASI